MTTDEALSELSSMNRQDLENWCKETYFDIFDTHAGKWLCKYSSEKLVAWFLMFCVWDTDSQEWKFTPAAEKFSELVDDASLNDL